MAKRYQLQDNGAGLSVLQRAKRINYQESGSKAPYLRTALVLDVLFQNFDRCATD